MMFGERLKKIRKDKGITQLELAEKLDVSQQAISNFEKLADPPKNSTIIKLADALGVPTSELVPGLILRYSDLASGNLIDFEVFQKIIDEATREKMIDKSLSYFNDAFLDINKNVQETAIKELDRRRAKFIDSLSDYDVVVDGSSVTFDGNKYELTSEQIDQLPDMTVEQVKALVRSLAKSNMRD